METSCLQKHTRNQNLIKSQKEEISELKLEKVELQQENTELKDELKAISNTQNPHQIDCDTWEV